MKVKRPGKVAHVVPLSDRALAVLEAAKVIFPEGVLVFPGSKRGKPLSGMAMPMLLRDMEADGHATVHGFRSTFRDWAAETTGFANEVVEMALAHEIGNKVEKAYRRGDLLEKRRELMQAWANYVSGTGANVVQLRPAATA
jgi:integrase